MNCDICHKDTTAGSHVNRGRYFEVHICPSCLMWSDDLRAVKARETIQNFKKRPRILTIYKHKGKYTPAEVISP